MPSKRVRSSSLIVTGGGSTTSVDPFTDAFSLKINLTEDNAAPSDAAAFAIALLQTDSNADLTETVTLAFPAPDFADTNLTPSELNSFTLRIWLSSSSGATNPGNADGQNNGTVATLQTAVAGASTIQMQSNLGVNVPSGVIITSASYRSWFKSVNTLITSTGRIDMTSTGGLFANIALFNNSALNATVDHLSGDFTFDLVAAGVNTLAKLQSCHISHQVNDAVAGVTPHVLTVDAGCIEIAGAFV